MNRVLIITILLIPLALGQSISGADNIDGYLRSTDALQITVPLTVSANTPAEIAKQRVHISQDTEQFIAQTCIPITPNQYDCTYRTRIQNEHGTVQYTVKTTNADGQEQATYTLGAQIDSEPPLILEYDILPKTSNNGNHTIILRARDPSSSRNCAGISQITITAGGRELHQSSQPPGQCVIDLTIPITLEQTGRQELCATVRDQFDHTAQECKNISYDTQGPTIVKSGYADYQGRYYTHVKGSGKELYAAVTLADDSGIATVTGGFGQLNTPARVLNNTYFFTTAQVIPGTTCGLIIEATDTIGNSAQHNITCTILADEEAPKIHAITTSSTDENGLPIIGPDADIELVIIENGIGLNPDLITLDLTPLGLDQRSPTRCEQNTNWHCTFENVTPRNQGVHTLPVQLRDHLGNTRQDHVVIEYIQDAPIITQTDQSPRFVTPQSSLEYLITVNTAVDIDASITFGGQTSDGECQIQTAQGEWICIARINNPPPGSHEAQIHIENHIGITTTKTVTFYSYALQDGEADLLDVTHATTSPRSIDRAVASQIAYPLYIYPQIQAQDGVEIIDTIVHCDHPAIVDGPRVLYGDTLRPAISIKVSRDLAKNTSQNAITIPCDLEFRITQNGILFNQVELESINTTIALTNLPLGSIDDNIKEKLASIDTTIHGIDREIEKWEGTNKALQTLRDTSSLIAQTDAALSFVTTAIWAVSSVLYKIPLLQGAGAGLWEGTCSAYVGQAGSTGLHHLVNLAVWYPGHFPGSIVLPTPKTASIIQSCQLCGFSGTLRAIIPQSEGEIIVNYEGERGAPTTLEAITTYSFEPFKSIHVAQACLCPAGIEYNLRKERQINCIYRNCVKDSAALGLPFSHCDRTLLEQNCLYVDGAAWKVAGGAAMASIMRDMLAELLSATPVMGPGTIWTAVCNPLQSAIGQEAYSCQAKGGDPFIDWAVPLCGAWSGGLELVETDFFGDNQFGWNTFNGQLEGQDFCIE